MSIGFVVVLLIATFGAMLAIPPSTGPNASPIAAATPVITPAKPGAAIKAQVRVIPVFKESQLASRN